MSVGGINQPPGGPAPVRPTAPIAPEVGIAPEPAPPSAPPSKDKYSAGEGERRAGVSNLIRSDDTNVGRPEPRRPAGGEPVRVPVEAREAPGRDAPAAQAPTAAPASNRPTDPGRPAAMGVVIPPAPGQAGVFIPTLPAPMPLPEAPVFPVNPAVKTLIDPSKVAPSRAEKLEVKQVSWSWVLPPADYKVELAEFKGWERAISRSVLPEGGELARTGDQHAIELPFGADRKFKGAIDANGQFRGPMPGREGAEELRGRIEGPTITVERWTVEDRAKQTAQWRTDLPPPYPIVPSGVRPQAPLDLEAIERGGGGKPLAVARVVNLIAETLDIYLTTGEVVTLPPGGTAPLTAQELDSPHLAELRRARCVDVLREA